MAQRTVSIEQFNFVFKSVEVDEDMQLICEPAYGWYEMENGSQVRMLPNELAHELNQHRELIGAQLWEQIKAENN